ncbi:MAG: hypothetical protein ACYS15_13625 [Planctomycetota bacterium]
MSNDSKSPDSEEMRPEYDFSNAVQGKYADRFAQGTNLVRIQPDVAKEFPDSQSVNEALRSLLKSRKDKPGKESA